MYAIRSYYVKIFEHAKVTGILKGRGANGRARVTGVETEHGSIEAEVVVNCAGMWARQLGENVITSYSIHYTKLYD